MKEREGGEESEKGGEATKDLVEDLAKKNDRSPHTNQEVNDIVRVEENDVQSFHSDANSQRRDKKEVAKIDGTIIRCHQMLN